ncbi:MAG: hypothetical protein GC185_10565 [Alphaproteobacteria bacterium]|nr:hypothetical protein [Alphaproteobacteria bacterium]
MTTADSQEKLKEEAKALSERLEKLIRDEDPQARMIRSLCVYAGLLTETLMEYEEPDVVMEQAFHRIADLLHSDPSEGDAPEPLLPLAYDIDHDTELGRHMARNVAQKLPKGLDDVHEIAIALVIGNFPLWEKEDFGRDRLLRMLIETVITALTFEMATQDFCDLLIEDFIADERSVSEGIIALAAVAGHLFEIARHSAPLPDDAELQFTNVMVRESLRHGTPGVKNWGVLAAANDAPIDDIPEYIKILKPQIDEFFVLIGMEDALGQAVAVAKAVGRMVAVITVEDVGQIHPSIAKSLAKTGMILGMRHHGGAQKISNDDGGAE